MWIVPSIISCVAPGSPPGGVQPEFVQLKSTSGTPPAGMVIVMGGMISPTWSVVAGSPISGCPLILWG